MIVNKIQRNLIIKDRYEKNIPTNDIAKEFNISIRTIQLLAKKNNWTKYDTELKRANRLIEKFKEEKRLKSRDIFINKIDFNDHGVYIGQTKDLKKRMQLHISSAKSKTHSSRTINNLVDEKGIDYLIAKFKKPKVLYCKLDGNIHEAYDKERYYILQHIDMGEKVLGGIY